MPYYQFIKTTDALFTPPPLLPSRGSDVTLLVVKGAKKVAREKKIETSEVLYSTAR